MAGKKDLDLNQEGKKVLAALKAAGGPVAPKQIAQSAGLDSKQVSEIIKGLKAQGLVESPVRCKWAITAAGKTQA